MQSAGLPLTPLAGFSRGVCPSASSLQTTRGHSAFPAARPPPAPWTALHPPVPTNVHVPEGGVPKKAASR